MLLNGEEITLRDNYIVTDVTFEQIVCTSFNIYFEFLKMYLF